MVSTLSIFLAKVLGIYFIVLCLALLNKTTRKNLFDLVEKEGISLVGLITLVIGIAMVVSHNVWTGWPIVITIIGWLSVIKGVCLLFFPTAYSGLYMKMRNSDWLYAFLIIGVVLGVFLTYVGFMTV
jgi:uncharacterized membrane protein (DUF441 family)